VEGSAVCVGLRFCSGFVWLRRHSERSEEPLYFALAVVCYWEVGPSAIYR